MPLNRHYSGGDHIYDDECLATVSTVGARIDVDGPGMRAFDGGRLVVIDLRLDTPATNDGPILFGVHNFRLEADGVSMEPIRLFERPSPTDQGSVEPAASTVLTIVFDVPVGATDVALVAQTTDCEDSECLLMDFDALPPCCGE